MDEGWVEMPQSDTPAYVHITLRDWFAGQALATMTHGSPLSVRDLAAWCYEMADAMLKARDEQ